MSLRTMAAMFDARSPSTSPGIGDAYRRQSLLRRLLLYAKSSEQEATENFTTEALAGAIRQSAEPMAQALAKAGAISGSSVRFSTVMTQVGLSGTGIVDLILGGDDGSGPIECLIEVKVGSGESGDQLQRYRNYIDAQNDLTRRVLVVLSREPIATNVDHRPLSWRDIWTAVTPQTTTRGSIWRDLKTFLEEIGMADDTGMAISAGEAASLGSAAGLCRKTTAILDDVLNHWRPTYPGIWPASVRQILAREFANDGRLVVIAGASTSPMWLYLGAIDEGNEAWATVWVEVRDRRAPVVDRLREAIGRGDVPNGWRGQIDRPEILITQERLVTLPDRLTAVAWFNARIQELGAADVMSAIALPPSGAEKGGGSVEA
jgi:hypothetical protein